MKRDDLRQTLKPLIKQCIKEVIFEDGVLSGIITEIVRGLDTQNMVVESRSEAMLAPDEEEQPKASDRQVALDRQRHDHKRQMEQQRRVLSESISGRLNGVDIFEGVNPISKAGNPSSAAGAPSSPLEGVDPSDPGVDISKLGIF